MNPEENSHQGYDNASSMEPIFLDNAFGNEKLSVETDDEF